LLADEANGGEHWEVVRLPAIAEENDPLDREPGEPLWPERIGLEALEDIRRSTRGPAWNAVYQQRPETEVTGALWTQAQIDDGRVAKAPELSRIVVGVDPAVTGTDQSDETGIIVAGRDSQDPPHAYVLADCSLVGTPAEWARRVIGGMDRHGGDCIIGEVNNGGDLVESNIRTVDPNVRFKAVRASRGKAVRAEPIAGLYEQGRVHHVGALEDLEYQLTGMTVDSYTREGSPDRLDSLVYAITELLVRKDPEPRIREL